MVVLNHTTMDKGIFRRLGFTEHETEIYLILLRNRELSAYEIAQKTGFYKQVCYDALNRLLEKGYVNAVSVGKSRLFKATNPEVIFEALNDEVEQLKSVLPELLKAHKQSEDNLSVEVYKGKNFVKIGFKDVVNELKKTGGENLCTSVDEAAFDILDPISIKKYVRDIGQYGITERVLIKKGVKGQFENKTTKYRTIPEEYFNPNPTQIYGNNIQIFLLGAVPHLIIIRNKELADAYRKQFNMLWKSATFLSKKE
ncbi:HTH-type sugar sensing transcriptional regulator TrmBL1 [uncultured archaeon]|nr:HTH-type sugar sensing transcriptional regulator TrmBL1 [uncultured archaeon]